MPSDPSVELDLAAVRAAFPVLADTVYLNTGTYGPMPEPALSALLEATAALERAGVACPIDLGAAMQQSREMVAHLLGAAADEIAFTRNATDGINLVLSGTKWQPGDEVITTDEEHEAMLHPLLYLQQRCGIVVHRVPVSPMAEEMLARLQRTATDRTRLVAMSHVTCETGTRLPAREICAWASERGVVTLLDGAQSIGVFPVDVRAIGCDYYAGNGHKWLSGPTGTGLFYGSGERLAQLAPAHVGAGSLERASADEAVAEPWTTGQRFEFGTRTWSLFPGLLASLRWLEDLGWRRVERHVADLSGYLKEHLAARPYLCTCTPRTWEQSSGLTSFRLRHLDAGQVMQQLVKERRVHTRHVPHYNAVRVSTAHFNSRGDIDSLLTALDSIAGR